MASLVVDSIRSSLDDLALLKTHPFVTSSFGVESRLKELERFLLIARKLGDDDNNPNKQVSLGSLFVRIAEVIRANSLKIQPYYRVLEDMGDEIEDLYAILVDYEEDLMSFAKEIDEWYTILSDSLHLYQSCPLTIDELMEIFDYFLEDNLNNFKWLNDPDIPKDFSIDPMKAIGEAIKLFRNFIRFVTGQSFEQQQLKNFVIHIAAVAIGAAQVTVRFSYLMRDQMIEECGQTQLKILALLQKIKPIEPRVFEIYKTALASLKSSMELHYSQTLDHDHHLVIMKDFIDFLLWSLLEKLPGDYCLMVSIKDQPQVLLFDGLRYLRTTMKMQPNKFGERIRDLSRVVLCDAGVLVFSLYQKDAQIDVGLADLLEKFKMISVEVDVQVPDTSIFNLPRTSILDFLKFLFDCLMELKSSTVDPDVQSHIQTIKEGMSYLTSVLEDLVKMQNQDEDLQALWNHGLQVASKMKVLIDQLVVGDIPNSFLTLFHSIREEMMIFKTVALKSFHGRRQEIEAPKVIWTSTALMPPQISAPGFEEVVGFENEMRSIIDGLTRGSRKLQVIAIVGMLGLGKTTLATKVYNDRTIMSHFHVRGWCSVSQVYNRRKLLLELLNHTLGKPPNMYLKKSEHDLAQELWRSLKGRRYLIFLDDVWEIEAVDSLKEALPDDYKESRILLTSRHHNVASNERTLSLPFLTGDESWELLQKKLFPKNDCPQVLSELGKQIANKCQGLRLTVVLVAGLLATLEPEPNVWNEVLESLSLGFISSMEQCINTLEVSYKHLPDYLKPCFLYFGLFPEDEEVSVKQLICLWIAEGFIHKTELESLEVVAIRYMMDLACRSLIIVFKKGSKGRGIICRIHDLLHDFCMAKAKEENFFQLLKGCDGILAFNEPYYFPRLCIHSKGKDCEYLRLFNPYIHSLLFFSHPDEWDNMLHFNSSILPVFKHLKVLYMQHINLGVEFPSKMQLLIQLRYLDIKGEWTEIPSSIGNLLNLETLIVHSRGTVALPNTIWNLHKLGHLHVFPNFYCSIENLDNSSILYELKSCSTAVFYSWDSSQKLMGKFPNVEILKCVVFDDWDSENHKKILLHDSLCQLKSLYMDTHFAQSKWGFMEPYYPQIEFSFPPSMLNLTLSGFELSQSEISTLGKLPNLEVLKLLDVTFPGQKFDMVEAEFSKLRLLKLVGLNIVRWTAFDDQFPNLQKLVLKKCRELEEIPACLEDTSRLDMIEVQFCSQSVVDLVKQIHDVQMDLGNSALQIHIIP